jgi:hypothetical protein
MGIEDSVFRVCLSPPYTAIFLFALLQKEFCYDASFLCVYCYKLGDNASYGSDNNITSAGT